MNDFIAVVGFVGSWFLVAGPIWQAAIELREEEFDQEAIANVKKDIPRPKQYSRWWWLLPPVAWILQWRENREYQNAINASLSTEQLEQTLSFLNKANGWIVVAVGAYLLAVKETWDGDQVFSLPTWLFWIMIVVLPIACISYAVYRVVWTRHALGQDPPKRSPRERQSRGR